MKVFNKRMLFNLVVAGLSIVLMNGISASADELETVESTINEDIYPTQYIDVYSPSRFMLSTVTTTDLQNPDGLSLKELIIENLKQCNTQPIDISSFKIPLSDDWKISAILQEIKMEYPEMFHTDGGHSSLYSKSTFLIAKLSLTYTSDNITLEQYQAQLKEIDDKFAEVIDKIDSNMSDVEKALVVHDYICDNFAYDQGLTKHDLYSFVSTGEGVCQAYMYAYDYILEKLGIECHPVMSNVINHTWNMVKLDGKYYQVDVTWDDFSSAELYGWASHEYFLITDDAISNTNHGSKATDSSNSDGWYLFYDDISATDSTYDSYSFKNTVLPYALVNGELYNIDNKGMFYKYDVDSNTTTNISSVSSDDLWCTWGGNIVNAYTYKFSSLHAYKDVLVVNKLNSICVLDTNGNILDTPYVRQGNNNAIFGMTLRNGKAMAQIESNLNTERSDFGTNIIEAFNMDEWYTNHKDDYAVTTTEEVTTTPEETTTEEVTTTTEETTTTPEETTTVIERVPCVELQEPDFENLYGYVFPAFSNGLAQQWTPNGLSQSDTYPIIAQPVAITGNGDYTLTINIPEGCEASNIQFLAMDSTLNSYQQNYLQENIMDNISWDITSIVVDGVEIPYTPSEGSLVMGNDGSSYRKLIYNTWTNPNVTDIDANVANTSSIVINFTISGIKTAEETTTTTVTTPEVTTTTEPVTTTTTFEEKFDLNGDGILGADDLLSLKSTLSGIFSGDILYDDATQYDLNHDGKINVLDFLELKRQILGMKE